MTRDFFERNRVQAVIASALACALVACGGTAGSLPAGSGGTYFDTLAVQTDFSGAPTTTSAFLRHSAAAGACTPENIYLGGAEDTWVWVNGTINKGKTVNWGKESFSLFTPQWVTSPIAGGYNISELQADIPGQSVTFSGQAAIPLNLMKGFTVTTYGSTSVSESIPSSSLLSKTPTIRITDNGVVKNNIPIGTSFTLTHGEVVTWDGQGELTETVTDPTSGGRIFVTSDYHSNYYPNVADTNYLDVGVYTSNVIIGGSLIDQALNTPSAGNVCTPAPISTPTPAPPATGCSLPSAAPTPEDSAIPRAHPTAIASANSCTS